MHLGHLSLVKAELAYHFGTKSYFTLNPRFKVFRYLLLTRHSRSGFFRTIRPCSMAKFKSKDSSYTVSCRLCVIAQVFRIAASEFDFATFLHSPSDEINFFHSVMYRGTAAKQIITFRNRIELINLARSILIRPTLNPFGGVVAKFSSKNDLFTQNYVSHSLCRCCYLFADT